MHVVVLANLKGGSGKSALSCSLAVAAMQDRQLAVLADPDEQASTKAWVEKRNKLRAEQPERGLFNVPYRSPKPLELGPWLDDVRASGRDPLVIVDTAGSMVDDLRLIIPHADTVLVPVLPTDEGLRTVRRTVILLRELKAPHFFVVNLAGVLQTRETQDTIATLEKAAPVVCAINRRIDFERAIGVGLGPQEYPPARQSAEEVAPLWSFIKGRMESSNG